jgi:hypothetical protein
MVHWIDIRALLPSLAHGLISSAVRAAEMSSATVIAVKTMV